MKILCIEDEEDIRSMLVEELEDEGYEVLEAENGELGLAMITSNCPDLILCDVNMPVMGGRELLVELRENHPKYNDVPFIFLSAFADNKDVISGLELGADDYLTKPVDLDILLAKVNGVLNNSERR